MIDMITDSICYVGVNDHDVDLFEGQYLVPNGMAYNSYVLLDEKIAVMDTVAANKTGEWLGKIAELMQSKQTSQSQSKDISDFMRAAPSAYGKVGEQPDYLVIQHMEPDHSASIEAFCRKFPETAVVANEMIFQMIGQYFPDLKIQKKVVVADGDSLSLGRHQLNFVFAPMVHWPEVMMTYESTEKVLFAADGFGKFGALDVEEDWEDEARRYYIGIVGKYGKPVQDVLQKAAGLDIRMICPLHGPVLKENLAHYLSLYDKWSSYEPESQGTVICYTSVYGHTKEAALMLRSELIQRGVPSVQIHDLARCDMAKAVEDAFRYDTLVLATTTYNAGIYPFMRDYIDHLTERNFQNRRVALIENGSWAPAAKDIMQEKFADSDRIRFARNNVTIVSALNDDTREQIVNLAEELARGYGIPSGREPQIEPPAMFKIGYGLYVVTSNDGSRDNGLITNTVVQVSDNPNRIAVNINKKNYSADVIRRTGRLNVCTLNEDVPFSVFQRFGFQSGRDTDKFDGFDYWTKAANGLPYLTRYANGFLALKVTGTVDMGTHWLFICEITESAVLNDIPTCTYNYYQENIKPKPKKVKGWVCSVCGYVYEGEELPPDFICPLCKHGAADFVRME